MSIRRYMPPGRVLLAIVALIVALWTNSIHKNMVSGAVAAVLLFAIAIWVSSLFGRRSP